MRRSPLLPVVAFAAACCLVPAYGQDAQRLVAISAARVTSALGFTPLNPANNLSDLSVAGTARTNLGLGTAATQNTGTSGATVPLLAGTNAWSGLNTYTAGTQWQDSGTQTLNNGIVTEATSQLINFGINDTRFGAGANAANTGGYIRLESRGLGLPFFQIYQKPAGTAAGSAAAVRVFAVDNGAAMIPKLSAAPTTAPGAGFFSLFVVAGATGGTCQLQGMAGTSTTPVTIINNVGSGC